MTAGRRGYLASEPDNAKGEADFVALVFRTGWVFEVLGIMIVGMGLYKIGFLSAGLPSGVYLATAVGGYTISMTIVLFCIQHSRQFGFSDAITTIYMFLPYGIQQIAGMLANASVVLLLVRSRRFVPFAASSSGRWAHCPLELPLHQRGLPVPVQVGSMEAVWRVGVLPAGLRCSVRVGRQHCR